MQQMQQQMQMQMQQQHQAQHPQHTQQQPAQPQQAAPADRRAPMSISAVSGLPLNGTLTKTPHTSDIFTSFATPPPPPAPPA